jgi:hypothetical protein
VVDQAWYENELSAVVGDPRVVRAVFDEWPSMNE